MNDRAPWGAVTVRRTESDVIEIVPPGAVPTPIDAARLSVPGGTLLFDATAPAEPPRAYLHDPYLALTWLGGVYGGDVARAAADPDRAEPVDVVAQRDRIGATVARLGLGLWLHRWWPAGIASIPTIDEALLELELGALAWQAEECFVVTEPIELLLAPHLGTLVAHVDGLRGGGSGTASRAALEVLTTALRAAVDVVADDVAGYAECEALLTTIEAEDAAAEALAPDDRSWSDFVAGLRLPAAALTRSGGGDSSVLWSGSSTVDWAQVTPRLVSAVEGNVSSWIAEVEDEAVVTVTVSAAPHVISAPDDQLWARVYLNGLPIVLPLFLTGRVFEGSAALSGYERGMEVEVDIYSHLHVRPARISSDGRARAAQERRHVRALIERRLDEVRPVEPHFLAERVAIEQGG